jgi:hypothetical protein
LQGIFLDKFKAKSLGQASLDKGSVLKYPNNFKENNKIHHVRNLNQIKLRRSHKLKANTRLKKAVKTFKKF